MRSNVILKSITVAICCSLIAQSAQAARFIDVSGVWSEKYINMLSDQGVIGAEPDGKFMPTQPVTRAVFAYWLVKVLGLDSQPVSSKPSFADVKTTDWCYKPVEIIRQNNYISGYADGFRPNQLIQKADLITIIARTLNAPTPDKAAVDKALSAYTDKSKVPEWAKVGIAQATIAKIMIGPNPKILDATKICSRGDTAALLYRLNQYVTHQTIKDTTDEAMAAAAAPASPVPQNAAPFASGVPPGAPGSTGVPQGPPAAYGQPGYPPAPYGAQGVPMQGQYGYPPQQYQGRVIEQTASNPPIYAAPPQYQQPSPQYQAPPQYPAPGPFQGGAYAQPIPGYPPLQGGYAQQAPYPPPGGAMQGRVSTVASGTKFQAALKNGLDSETTVVGEPVEASLASPIMSGGVEVVPAGSRVLGSVTNVISAKRFKFGANGKIDIKFTSVETPDGRKIPLSASIDENEMHLTGGTTGGRVGKSLLTTGAGAGGGAALGTALGAIVGATGRGQVGRSTGMGAAFGTALGGGVGLVGAGVRKGSEIKIKAGSSLPVQLNESMQVAGAAPASYYPPPYSQQYGGYPQGYAPPVQNYPPPQAYPAQQPPPAYPQQ
jgi:S-layer homology domain